MSVSTPVPILLVDDDPAALALLSAYVTNAGYPVLTARDGEEAWPMLLELGPPLVVADWDMPGVDGLELCRRIRAHEGISYAYVIILTASRHSEDNIVAAFDAGADDYIVKPFQPKELLARLRAGARVVRLQQELEARTREVHKTNAELAVTNDKLSSVNERLHTVAGTDELTGLPNRRVAMERLRETWHATERYNDSFSCIAIDVDRLKQCNDRHGHSAGDLVLQRVAQVLSEARRREETVARIGGEEFLIILPRTPKQKAVVAAEHVRRAVETVRVAAGNASISVTISLGVAERSPSTLEVDDLLREVDEAMHAAKAAGGNRVVVAGGPPTGDRDDTDRPPALIPERWAAEAAVAPDETTTVLLVDEDNDARAFCRRTLERAGYCVEEVGSVPDAPAHVDLVAPDVIVIDPDTRNGNGLALVRRLKTGSNTQAIPVLITSARSDALDVKSGIDAGADDYLSKPISPQAFLLHVRSVVRAHRQLGCSNAIRGEQSRAIGLVADYCRDMAAVDSLKQVVERSVGAVAALTCSRRIILLLLDEKTRRVAAVEHVGFDKAEQELLGVVMGEGILGEAYSVRKPRVVESDAHLVETGTRLDRELLAPAPAVAVPLCSHEGVIGLLTIAGRVSRRPFTDLELEYINLIGNIAASAVHERVTQEARDAARFSIVVALAQLAERRDSDTGRHLDRVSKFCAVLAQELRAGGRYADVITDRFITDLEQAVLLHDIGKVAVPDHILLKPEALTEAEFVAVQTHTTVGARTIRSIINRVPGVTYLTMAEEIAHAHHEKYDGTGYPRGLAREEIPLAARIASVADVYDAVTTKRPYKEALSHETAVAIITSLCGKQFDPDLVDAFHRCAERFKELAVALADDPEEQVRWLGGLAAEHPALAQVSIC